jgi:serine/threonine-protein kinase
MPAPRDCPAIESLRALFGDGVPPEQRDRYERHLDACAACQDHLDRAEECQDELRRLGRRVGDPTVLPADPGVARFLDRLHEMTWPGQSAAATPDQLRFRRLTNRPDILGTLGRYEVRGVLGRGGMGVVFRAFDPALQRPVALKVLAPHLATSPMARRRFTREARAAAAVRHEHVVAVHRVEEADGLPYLVMQCIAGESLQDRLDRAGPLAVAEVVRIGYEAASGLAAAHARGLIHRDVKPSNILLEGAPAASATGGRVKITDFGLARAVDEGRLTQSGVVAGTPEYMAPEQARGEAIDHRADLFSLGSVLYALCGGRPPFQGPTALAVLGQVTDQAPTPLRELNPDVPAWLEQLIARLLAKDPVERFQTAAEVAAVLEGCLARLGRPAPVAAAGPREAAARPRAGKRLLRRFWPGALLLLPALGLAVCLAAQATPPGGEAPHSCVISFRGRPLPPEIEPFGPLEQRFLKVEAEGLRITLPRDRADLSPLGLSLAGTVGGDFEITAAFAVLQADEPALGAPSYGIGFMISINEAARIGRLERANGNHVVTWDRWATVNGETRFLIGSVPGTARAGRLRLARTGTTLHFLWAPDGAGEDYEEISQCEFGDQDITLLRLELGADAGGRAGALDVRLVDLTIRSNTPVAVAGQTPGTEGQVTGRSSAWFIAAGLLGLGIVLTAVVWRGRRRTGKRPAAEAAAARPRQPTAAAPAVSFPCSGCGKPLKARATSAGKQVKCPRCEATVPVPGAPSPRRHPAGE